MRKIKFDKLVLIFFWIFLYFMFFSIVLRFLTRQILVEKLGWDNSFTHFVFAGKEEMNKVNSDEGDDEVLVNIDWKKEYPFNSPEETNEEEEDSEIKKIEEKIFDFENKIEVYTTDLLIGQYDMTVAAKTYNDMINCPMMQTKQDSDQEILYLQNGYLTFKQELIDKKCIDEAADVIADFSAYLNNADINFVYMNTGSKVCPDDKQLPFGAVEYSNENGDNIINALKERGVNTLDFREKMIDEGLDWYKSYYIYDHHWKTTTSLWAAGIMAEYLNDNFEFDFDLSFFDPAKYNIKRYDNYFLGGQGRIATLSNSELEPYDRIFPSFETVFNLTIPSRNINAEGSYEEVLFDQKGFDQIADYSEHDFIEKKDAYHSINLRNDALCRIVNLDPPNNRDKKILFIYDSFSWYIASFLATDVSEITTLHLYSFDGSVRSLIDKTKPDIVVMAYCERNIGPVEENSKHNNMYDLR